VYEAVDVEPKEPEAVIVCAILEAAAGT